MLSKMENAALECLAEISMLRFFPADEFTRSSVVKLLLRMATQPEQLHWLAETMVSRFNDWPGPGQLRAVFCTRFRPADCIETWLDPSIPASAALSNELEQRYIDQHEERKRALPTKQAMRLLEEANVEKGKLQ